MEVICVFVILLDGGDCVMMHLFYSHHDHISCLFCKRDLQKRWYSAKETYHLEEPTTRICTYSILTM